MIRKKKSKKATLQGVKMEKKKIKKHQVWETDKEGAVPYS